MGISSDKIKLPIWNWTLLLLGLYPLTVAGQDLTYMDRNRFQSVGIGVLNGFGNLPHFTYNERVENGNGDTVTVLRKDAAKYRGMGGCYYENRFNLWNYSDWLSLSVSAQVRFELIDVDPIAFGDGKFIGLRPGFSAFLDLNIGQYSTYNNIHGTGLNIGLGFDNSYYLVWNHDIHKKLLSTARARLGFVRTISFKRRRQVSIMMDFGIPKEFVSNWEGIFDYKPYSGLEYANSNIQIWLLIGRNQK